VLPLVKRALKVLSDLEVAPQLGLLKSTLLQLDSTFSERNYGASSFLDFAEKLAQSGLVTPKHSGRSVIVELNNNFDESTPDAAAAVVSSPAVPRPLPGAPEEPSEEQPAGDNSQLPQTADNPQLPQIGYQAEGVRLVGQMLRGANARWPMYLRNVKQVLRASNGGFDERRYGFGGLMDLLRACQREGLVRVERDRRGGLRVFPSQGLHRPDLAPTMPRDAEQESQNLETQPLSEESQPQITEEDLDTRGNSIDHDEGDSESQPGPMPIDTTAELLGRAKPKRARVGAAVARGTKKTAVRKPAAKRTRAKRSTESAD